MRSQVATHNCFLFPKSMTGSFIIFCRTVCYFEMEAVIFNNLTDSMFLILPPTGSFPSESISSLTICLWFLVSRSSQGQGPITQPLVNLYSMNDTNLLDLTYDNGVVSFTVAEDRGIPTLGVVSCTNINKRFL